MYSLDLQIDVPLLNSDFKLEKFKEPTHLRPPTNSIVSPELLAFFLSHGLTIGSEIFYSPPGAHTTIHADGVGDIIKLNWIIGGKDSVMQWWKPNVEKSIVYTEHNSPTIRYMRHEVTLLYSVEVKQPSMVQVGIPHNVSNKIEDRWCISLIPVCKDTRARLTWQQGLDIFSHYAIQA